MTAVQRVYPQVVMCWRAAGAGQQRMPSRKAPCSSMQARGAQGSKTLGKGAAKAETDVEPRKHRIAHRGAPCSPRRQAAGGVRRDPERSNGAASWLCAAPTSVAERCGASERRNHTRKASPCSRGGRAEEGWVTVLVLQQRALQDCCASPGATAKDPRGHAVSKPRACAAGFCAGVSCLKAVIVEDVPRGGRRFVCALQQTQGVRE